MVNLQQLKILKKQKGLTLQEISDLAGVPKRTVDDIFSGHTKNPRIDTVQAIEKALGLAPQWTEEEQAQGVGNHAIVLSQKEKDRFNLLMDSDDVLGEEFTNAYLKSLQIIIQQTKTK